MDSSGKVLPHKLHQVSRLFDQETDLQIRIFAKWLKWNPITSLGQKVKCGLNDHEVNF